MGCHSRLKASNVSSGAIDSPAAANVELTNSDNCDETAVASNVSGSFAIDAADSARSEAAAAAATAGWVSSIASTSSFSA